MWQIYRKAALKIVRDLGEEIFPETAALEEQQRRNSSTQEEPLHETPTLPNPSVQPVDNSPSELEGPVTTEPRKPLDVPDSVHVSITPDNLKDYVGPPLYHKDRLYASPPPPGVSTGLGYLGNGSGAVMPIEATVRISISFRCHADPMVEYGGQGESATYG